MDRLGHHCRHCRFYTPEGRRGGHCSQLGVKVSGFWQSCDLSLPSFAPSWESAEVFSGNHHDRITIMLKKKLKKKLTKHRIYIRIPPRYQADPIIFNLVSLYNVTININAALLSGNGETEGWFDLDLMGSPISIDAALMYLSDLDLEAWTGNSILESTFLRPL